MRRRSTRASIRSLRTAPRWWGPTRACRRCTRTRCRIWPIATVSVITKSFAPTPVWTCGCRGRARSEHRLYYYPKPRKGEQPVVITYPVSIGKMDWRTPLGDTHVIAKIKHPAWYPPESIRKEHAANGDPLPKVVGAGPDNPLGDFALRLAAGNGEYMIHGTNNPTAVGMAVTHGCIRMYPEDVAAVFALVPVGTPVRLINEPVKVAWVDGQLLLEAHPPVDEEGQSIEPDVQLLSQMLDQALGSNTAAINWDLARATLVAASGMPTLVGLAAEPDTPPAPQAAAGVSQTSR
ncbi:MAG: hypothetical protein E6K51_02625 [Gammaproteobacteria bacterium]|nr:MAG: hypothetical protein E6K51_02625 [Gammaproteobacteria bacterium]